MWLQINNDKMKNKILLLLIIPVIVLIPNVLSHLDAGQDKVIDNYQVDFGYSPENPKTTEKVVIALTLFNNTNQKVIEPESIWIRISSSEEVVFAGTLKQESGNVAFTYRFPYADNYEITSRFNKGRPYCDRHFTYQKGYHKYKKNINKYFKKQLIKKMKKKVRRRNISCIHYIYKNK